MKHPKYQEVSPCFFADPAFFDLLKSASLTTLDDVFACDGEHINPQFLPDHRKRMRISLSPDGPNAYLKTYHRPPKGEQLRNWIEHRHRATSAEYDWRPILDMENEGISVPHTIAYGIEWDGLFEKRSFILIQELADAYPLEEKLPDCLTQKTKQACDKRNDFIGQLADFVRTFHDTGYRHRDLYLCHIFFGHDRSFYLIDLQRLFKPVLLGERFRIKDIAQLYYSAPGSVFSQTDRLRFYKQYSQHQKLSTQDRRFIKRVVSKARHMANRDVKRNRPAPFLNG